MAESQSSPESPISPHRDSDHHGSLEGFAGLFRAEIKIWTGAETDPLILTGCMNNTWQLDRLFLQQEYAGDGVVGEPAFQGKGFWGYNTTTQRYEGFWIDNASNTMQFEQGDVDDSGKVWQMQGHFVAPQDGATIMKRSEITLVDEARHHVKVFLKSNESSEKLAMEMEYTRVDNKGAIEEEKGQIDE